MKYNIINNNNYYSKDNYIDNDNRMMNVNRGYNDGSRPPKGKSFNNDNFKESNHMSNNYYKWERFWFYFKY